MTDKRSIIGLVLIFLIFVGFMWWQSPSKEERAEMHRKQDSLYRVQQREMDSVMRLEALAKTNSLLDSNNDSVLSLEEKRRKEELSIFSNAAVGERSKLKIDNELISFNISNLGGQISSVELKDYKTFEQKPLYLINDNDSLINLVFQTSDNRAINTNQLYFKIFINDKEVSGDEHYSVKGNDSLIVSLRAYANNANDTSATYDLSRYLEFRYTIFGSNYRIKYAIFFNGLDNAIAQSQYMDFEFRNDLRHQEKNGKNERATSSIYYRSKTDESVENITDGKDNTESIKSPLKWISYKQQFFSTTIIADDEFLNADIEVQTKAITDTSQNYLCSMGSIIGIPFNSADKNHSVGMSLYFGPNKYNILKSYDLNLERQIPLGWGFFLFQWINRFAVLPVFNSLEQLNWNYGIIILVLTVILKLILLPIAFKSYSSSAKMKILQPEVNEINKKYPKKEQALEKQKAVMALYKKAGASPMAGCIPMLLQFPILLAMYRFFPASIELRQQPFLWADDLSTYDSILTLPFNIPIYGDHVSLFCLLMSIANVFYTIINMKQSVQSNSLPGMKTMMYLMPVMLLFMFNSFSAGLNYYYFISTCITFLQMFIIRRMISEDKIRERIRVASTKPVKKSNFMERIEKMQKMNQEIAGQRQQNQRKK